MATSAARLAANRRNAQKSTGPKTAAGKAASRSNAVRHGLRAKVLIVEFGANSAEVERERQAWVEALAPKNIIAQRLADVAFRSHRLWQHAVDTEDALIAARTRRAARRFDRKREHQIARAAEQLMWMPEQSLAVFQESVEGCAVWLELVLREEHEFLEGYWTKSMHDTLQYLGGSSANRLDADLATASELVLGFDQIIKLATDPFLGLKPPAEMEAIAEKQRAHIKDPEQNPPPTPEEEAVYRDGFLWWTKLLDKERSVVESEIESLRPDAESARGVIASVFEDIKLIISNRLEDLQKEGGLDVRRRIVIEKAKVDTSLDGRLRHRYVADALRDLLKALKAAQEACGARLADLISVPDPVEIEPDHDTAEVEPTPAEAYVEATPEIKLIATTATSPNEPNEPETAFADLDGCNDVEVVASVEPEPEIDQLAWL